MKQRQQGKDWFWLCLMLLAVGILAVLQYRWLGELSVTEQEYLRSKAKDEVERRAAAMRAEIESLARILTPTAGELESLGPEAAHRARTAELTHVSLLIERVLAAVVAGNEIQLYEVWPTWRAVPWPPEWMSIRAEFLRTRFGANNSTRRGYDRPVGVWERPVFGPDGELEWLILKWSEPGFAQRWARPITGFTTEVRVGDRKLVAREFESNQPPDLVEKPGPVWREPGHMGLEVTVSLWSEEGGLAAMLEAARRRNLAIAFALLSLVLVAGWFLLQQARKSRELAQQQMRFVAGVSHELRTPLTVITGAAYNLASGVVKEPAQQEKYARLIGDQARELTEMVEQVMDFSARRERPLSVESVDVASWVEQSIEAAGPEIGKAECEVDLDIGAGLPPVLGNKAEFVRALRNLLANAARHGGAGKWIQVRAQRNGDFVEVAVADRGPGVPAADREKIFAPFVRGEGAVSAQVRGTGLGLSLVREAMERSGGGVNVQDAPGGGAEFVLKVPVR